MPTFLPWLAETLAILGLWLAGRKSWSGWVLGVVAQVLWVYFGLFTQQWSFFVFGLLFGIVNLKNWIAWTRKPADEHVAQQHPEDAGPLGAVCSCGR